MQPFTLFCNISVKYNYLKKRNIPDTFVETRSDKYTPSFCLVSLRLMSNRICQGSVVKELHLRDEFVKLVFSGINTILEIKCNYV